MEEALVKRVQTLIERRGRPAIAALLVPRVRAVVAPVLPAGAALLDEALALDWQAPAPRAAFLERLQAATDDWMSSGESIDAAVASQQAASLCDPRVASPATLAAAVIETTAAAHGVATTGAHDAALCARWEDETVRLLEASLP